MAFTHRPSTNGHANTGVTVKSTNIGDAETLQRVVEKLRERHGKQFRKTTGFEKEEELHISWRMLTGNSTKREVETLGGFYGTWEGNLREEVYDILVKLCRSPPRPSVKPRKERILL